MGHCILPVVVDNLLAAVGIGQVVHSPGEDVGLLVHTVEEADHMIEEIDRTVDHTAEAVGHIAGLAAHIAGHTAAAAHHIAEAAVGSLAVDKVAALDRHNPVEVRKQFD